MSELFTTENLIAFLTLAALEIVLGIDNLVFISILTAKVEQSKQAFARRVGLGLALGMRILLLLAIGWVMGLTTPLFTVMEHEITGKSLILLIGGLFLIGKATFEIHEKMTHAEAGTEAAAGSATMGSVLTQIVLLDVVFSLDSVITAVGMVKSITVMVAAVMVAVGVMIVFANAVADFIEKNPTLKILALSFLILIGVLLTADGLGQHLDKGYVYFAMAFSLVVELVNKKVRDKQRATSTPA